MNKKLIRALPAVVPLVAIGGFVAANSMVQPAQPQAAIAAEQGYVCPVTGEELPCPKCCVLNRDKTE